MQDKEYSKKTFGIDFPLLVKMDGVYNDLDRVRYYKDPVVINNETYLMCSQWAESPANNDRPYLVKWIEEHS